MCEKSKRSTYAKLETLAADLGLVIDSSRILPGVDGAYFRLKNTQPVVYLSPLLSLPQRVSVLAEEIGHHLTSDGDSVIRFRASDVEVTRSEFRAMKAAVEIVFDDFDLASLMLNPHTDVDASGGSFCEPLMVRDLALRYDVTDSFVESACDVWRRKGLLYGR